MKYISNGGRNNSVSKLVSANSFTNSHMTPKKNMTSNISLRSINSGKKQDVAQFRMSKLYEGNQQIQKMRLKIANKIREKAQILREKTNVKFETDVRNFDKSAEKDIQGIFRDTRYRNRKEQRLGEWRNKKYKNQF
mmetsp:Transcript_36990/g.36589  ORF Transcript_36990/g.36589 Transcript_36990/m.36589 type:complete len:136 (-) Transcript_36990:22-429(-)